MTGDNIIQFPTPEEKPSPQESSFDISFRNCPGEWQSEPDHFEFFDDRTAYHCLGARTAMGTWCGYVSVPKKHPLYGKDRNRVNPLVQIHGGITFEGAMHGKTGRWYFGFDCCHAFDLIPCMIALMESSGFAKELLEFDETLRDFLGKHGLGYKPMKEYRNIRYVKSECKRMARQLKLLERRK